MKVVFLILKTSLSGDGSVRKELIFSVTGMSCANCALKIEKILIGRPGVLEVGVSSITNKVRRDSMSSAFCS